MAAALTKDLVSEANVRDVEPPLPDARRRHSERFRTVSNRYPRRVAEAYEGDLERAMAATDGQVAMAVATWERAQGIEPRDWYAIGTAEGREPARTVPPPVPRVAVWRANVGDVADRPRQVVAVWRADDLSDLKHDGFADVREAREFVRDLNRRVADAHASQTVAAPPAAATPRRRQGHAPRTQRRVTGKRRGSSGQSPAGGERPRRSDDDDPPGVGRRACARCRASFVPKRRKSAHCPECRDAAKQAEYRHRHRVDVDGVRGVEPKSPEPLPRAVVVRSTRRIEVHPALGVARYLNGSGPKWPGSIVYRVLDFSTTDDRAAA